jgi:glycosyltransferase involved in cell wall biosynthesis
LLEALSLKTPVIAFDCKSGPNEIVKDHVNGLLVEDQNEEQLIIALNKLLNDTFYMDIKNNTQIGLDVFSEDKIIQEWETLFENKR